MATRSADALRLSEAMSLKASMAGLHQGGGKAVVHWDDPDRPRPAALLEALGRAIDELGGRYLAAEDVGATTADMDALARVTPWVTGVDERAGGSGDPSPVTAYGVAWAMRAALQELDGDGSLTGRTVHVCGVGHVGAPLVDLLVTEGAHVSVSDVFADRVAAVVDRHHVTVHAPEDALRVECDVLAPCALGGVFHDATIPQLRCRAVAGAANNQLADDRAAEQLAERGVLFVPDFVASAGGIVNIAEEFVGYDRTRALEHTAEIGPTTTRVLQTALRPRRHPPARGRGPRPRPHRRGRCRPPMATRRRRRLDQRRPPRPAPPVPLTNRRRQRGV